jgi:hypothetical protein
MEATLSSSATTLRLRGAVGLAALGATLLVTPPAAAAPDASREAPVSEGTSAASAIGSLASGDELLPGEWLESPNGAYAFVVEADGALTVYGPPGAIWADDDAYGADVVLMQGDGNLVAYDGNGQPLWATGTGAAGSVLVMQDDGNLVVYRPGGVPVWASKSTAIDGWAGDRLMSGQQLSPDEYIESADGSYAAVMQGDGNLVVYGPAGAIWASGTAVAGTSLVMQGDGNLVAYRPNAQPVWHTFTSDRSDALVKMQDDGNLVVYRTDGTPLWASASSAGTKVARNDLLTGQRLSPGQMLVSPNGRYRLVMQTDGNLVVYGPAGPNWASGKAVANSSLVNVPDGNVVVAPHPHARAIWQTATGFPFGGAEGRLVIQDDGNLVFYRNSGHAVWASLNPGTWRTGAPLASAPSSGWW